MSQDLLLSGGVLEQQLNSLPDEGKCSWKKLITAELLRDKDRYIELDRELTSLYESDSVNPRKENIFRAFRECPLEKCICLKAGQDPYPTASHAVGLAFSVPAGCKKPPSLKNILKELESDIGPDIGVRDGDLSPWAKQGVLLLNTSLTVKEGEPNSHRALWGDFAINILSAFNQIQKTPVAFVLWGKQAGEIGKHLERNTPLEYPRKFIYSAHPSPLSAYRGFFGSKPFSQTNEFLIENGLNPIKW